MEPMEVGSGDSDVHLPLKTKSGSELVGAELLLLLPEHRGLKQFAGLWSGILGNDVDVDVDVGVTVSAVGVANANATAKP